MPGEFETLRQPPLPLDRPALLYGIVCRDPTLVELELTAQAGYQIVWVDLQHAALSVSEAVCACRTIAHLGMVPLVRVGGLSGSQIQILADGGLKALLLPDVKDAAMASEFVQLAKYPPVGRLSLSSCSAGSGICSTRGSPSIRTAFMRPPARFERCAK